MNCQELAQLLDDGDIRNVPSAKRRELDAHLSGCASCAAEWRVQERIVMAPVPRTPPGFVELCRQLVEAGVARLMPRRVVLYSSVLALAAAAAMLAWRTWAPSADAPVVAAEPVVAVSMQAPEPEQPALAPAPLPDPVPEPPAEQPMLPPPGTFLVAVPPLQFDGTDVEGHAIALRFRDRVIELLRGVPNLVLEDALRNDGVMAVEIELRMKYTGSMAPTTRQVDLQIQTATEIAAVQAADAAEASMSPADRERSQWQRRIADAEKQVRSLRGGNTSLTLLLGQGAPRLAIIDAALSPPGDRVESAAQTLVRDLRINVFPPDETFEREQLGVLRNPGERTAVRMRALGALLSYAERRGGFHLASPAVVRAGGELALVWEGRSSSDRSIIWDGLALTGSPELVPYLIRGLNESPQTEARLQLVKILAGSYVDDPRARAALAAAATSNDQQTVRMAAARETGGSRWNDYIVSTLQNPALSDVQRLQPVADMVPGAPGTLGTSPKSKLALEDHHLRELGVLIIRLAPDPSASETVTKALFAAGAMEVPGALDMLLDVYRSLRMEDVPPGVGRVSLMSARRTARSLITFRYGNDPRGRTFIEQMARSSDLTESSMAQSQLMILDAKAEAEKTRGSRAPEQ